MEYFCIDDDVVDVGAIVAVVLLVLRFRARDINKGDAARISADSKWDFI